MTPASGFDAVIPKESVRHLSRGYHIEQPVPMVRTTTAPLNVTWRASLGMSLYPCTMHTSPVYWGQWLKPQCLHLHNGSNDNNLIPHPEE